MAFLAISAVIIIAVSYLIKGSFDSARQDLIVKEFKAIHLAALNYTRTNGSQRSIGLDFNMLKSRGELPQNFNIINFNQAYGSNQIFFELADDLGGAIIHSPLLDVSVSNKDCFNILPKLNGLYTANFSGTINKGLSVVGAITNAQVDLIMPISIANASAACSAMSPTEMVYIAGYIYY